MFVFFGYNSYLAHKSAELNSKKEDVIIFTLQKIHTALEKKNDIDQQNANNMRDLVNMVQQNSTEIKDLKNDFYRYERKR